MMIPLIGLPEFAAAHIESFPYGLPPDVAGRHQSRIESWGLELASWARINGEGITICPEPLGDPHQPHGTRAAEILLGPEQKPYIWKAGESRYRVETACQQILGLLGADSGLRPIHGFGIAGGGAWEKIQAQTEVPPPEVIARAFAHLTVLAAAFNLPDLHHENIAWDGEAFRLWDTEMFAGPTPKHPAPHFMTRLQMMADRAHWCALYWPHPNLRWGGEGVQAHLAGFLGEAVARFQANWEAMLAIREAISGLPTRVILVRSQDMGRLMPYAMDEGFRALAWHEFMTNIPEDFDRAAAFNDLTNGCIPIHHQPIPPAADSNIGAIRPDNGMVGIFQSILRAYELRQMRVQPTLEDILISVRQIDPLTPNGPAEFDAPSEEGVGRELRWDHPGLCFGLGGIAYLHAVETALGQPHIAPSSQEVQETQANRIRSQRPWAGIFKGVGGDFLYGWGLHRLGALKPDLTAVLDDRLSYLATARGPEGVLDLGLGLAGNLLGMARASEFLPNRQKDLLVWGQTLANQIQAEVAELLAEPDRVRYANHALAHGLAGVTLALFAARQSLGLETPYLEPLRDQLSTHLASKDLTVPPPGPHCHDWAGVLAALRATGDDIRWRHQQIVPPGDSGQPHPTNGCCGFGALHLGRLLPMNIHQIPDLACHDTTPFGYLGLAGFHTIKLAAYGSVPDPIWGRDIQPPTP